MGADEFNEQRLPAVIHGRYQAVLIAADIENHPAIGNETGTSIHGFDIVWPAPLCLSCFVLVPSVNGSIQRIAGTQDRDSRPPDLYILNQSKELLFFTHRSIVKRMAACLKSALKDK